jgi:hypothetical protein
MRANSRRALTMTVLGASLLLAGRLHAYLTGQAASIVIGQPDMTSGSINQGNAFPSSNTLRVPNDVLVVGNKLLISDRFNNRILIFNTIPTVNNAPADVVIGQPDMSSGSPNQGGAINANTLNEPIGIFSSNGTNLIVADCTNNRVLIYNTIPTVNNASADVVVGQANMTTSLPTFCQPNRLYCPQDIASDGIKLIISDYGYNRILIFNTLPTINDASANVVIGQPDMISGVMNQGGSAAANTLAHPGLMDFDGVNLYMADYTNQRVLIYHGLPTINNVSADVVIGQPDFFTTTINTGGLGANTLHRPFVVRSYGSKLYISDNENHRLLIFNSIPTVNFAAADEVIGQINMTSNGPGITATTLNFTYASDLNSTQLFLCDGQNHRVLIYQDGLLPIPTPVLTQTVTVTPTGTPVLADTPTATPTSSPGTFSPDLIHIPGSLVRVSKGEPLRFTLNLNQGTRVKIQLYGVDSRHAATILDEWRAAGSHSITHNLNDLGSGLYFLYAEAGEQRSRYKIVVIR